MNPKKDYTFREAIFFIPLIFATCLLFSQSYETVTIGSQTWMKHNLNRDILGSVCYQEDSSNCEKYGRLYLWQAAIDACPDGFRLPTDQDWTILTDFLGGADSAGTSLKEGGRSGFDALLAGNYQNEIGIYSYKDVKGYYWTASAFSYHTAWIRSFGAGLRNVNRTTIGKSFYFSVRCIKIE
ncbi:MAG: FISUMP domain-containing protein [bacterium]